ncbi:hypothetical protein L4D76_28205 [Photobacterium sagamiensis]|uniref:hypothetical protein n=1 Tax=Photobacterium sagamiensis TaxID=2910241 RepID=UPI003D131DDB
MSETNKFELYKIQFPEERKKQLDATIGLESFLINCFPKSLWYSEDHNAILLDIPEEVTEFHEKIQRLCSLPSGGFHCELKELKDHELLHEERKWLDERIQLRVDLLENIFPGLVNKVPKPSFRIHLISLYKV